jgi:hypothetical protein
MKRLPPGWVDDYANAVVSFGAGAGETSLLKAYELGRLAASQGVLAIDVAMAHHNVIGGLLKERLSEADLLRINRAGEVLAECL